MLIGLTRLHAAHIHHRSQGHGKSSTPTRAAIYAILLLRDFTHQNTPGRRPYSTWAEERRRPHLDRFDSLCANAVREILFTFSTHSWFGYQRKSATYVELDLLLHC
ncbi:hypothetical protein CBOM_08007 [Ceraceosorus bombacis]|uniref:Uncharacterized protein n=1 Tax=Ceraceosorus bombacis TaxID=401625 RepID=A0A0P1BIS2_9BASI|nr:hypothetical protein CBOM_08007 [Ceraceosorus bombacis]